MAETKISPSQYFLYIDPDGGTAYALVICLLSHTFNSSTAVNDASSMCGPDSAPGDISSTINLDGQIVIDPDSPDEISAWTVFALQQAKTTIGWKIGRGIPVAGDETKEGQGFISSYTETHNKDNVSAFTATISVKGDINTTMETGS